MAEYCLLTSPCEIPPLLSSTCNIRSDSGLPMSQPTWWLTCSEALPEDGSLCVFVTRERGVPTALAPFTVSPGAGGLLCMPGGRLGEPYDVGWADARSLQSLAGAIAGSGRPLYLERVMADSPFVAALSRAYRGRGIVRIRPRQPYPYIDCEGGEAGVIAALSSSLRSDLRRARRLAERNGSVSFEVSSPRSPRELASAWCEALSVESDGWKGRQASALSLNDRIRPIYEKYARRAARAGGGFLPRQRNLLFGGGGGAYRQEH